MKFIIAGRTGVFSWSAWLADFIFREMWIKQIILRDPSPESFAWPDKDLSYWPIFVHSSFRDFETRVVRMVRVVYREWLWSGYGFLLWYAICSKELWLSLWIKNRSLKSYLTCLFSWFGKTKLIVISVTSMFFFVREPCQSLVLPCTTLIIREFTKLPGQRRGQRHFKK